MLQLLKLSVQHWCNGMISLSTELSRMNWLASCSLALYRPTFVENLSSTKDLCLLCHSQHKFLVAGSLYCILIPGKGKGAIRASGLFLMYNGYQNEQVRLFGWGPFMGGLGWECICLSCHSCSIGSAPDAFLPLEQLLRDKGCVV